MVPTARGHALAREVPKIIGDIEHMLAPADPFVPSTSSRTFRLIAPDFIMPMVVTLLRKSREDAPGISLELVPVTPDALADMKQGRCDALVAPSGLRDDALRGHSLGLWPWAVFGRTGHKAFADWSPASWARYPHLQVRAAGPEGKGPVDQMAAKLSLTRKIGAIVPHFSAAAFVLAETDLLLTVPTIAVQGLSNHYGLEQREVPFALPPLKLPLFHNAKKGDEPDVRWFRDEVKDAFSKMA